MGFEIQDQSLLAVSQKVSVAWPMRYYTYCQSNMQKINDFLIGKRNKVWFYEHLVAEDSVIATLHSDKKNLQAAGSYLHQSIDQAIDDLREGKSNFISLHFLV